MHQVSAIRGTIALLEDHNPKCAKAEVNGRGRPQDPYGNGQRLFFARSTGRYKRPIPSTIKIGRFKPSRQIFPPCRTLRIRSDVHVILVLEIVSDFNGHLSAGATLSEREVNAGHGSIVDAHRLYRLFAPSSGPRLPRGASRPLAALVLREAALSEAVPHDGRGDELRI